MSIFWSPQTQPSQKLHFAFSGYFLQHRRIIYGLMEACTQFHIPSSFSWGKNAALVHRKESLGLANLGGGNFHLQAECMTEDNHSPAYHKVMDSGKAWLKNASGPQKGGQVWSPESVGFFRWEPKGSWTGRLCLSWVWPGGCMESRGPQGFLQVPL